MLVVWGTTVTSTRSSGWIGTLRIRHGRILAAIPRSTIHTDPRSATGGTGGLLGIQAGEQLIRKRVERRRGQIALIGCSATQNLKHSRPLVRFGKRVKQFE